MNVVSIADLSSLERSRLRDTFRAIEDWQERARRTTTAPTCSDLQRPVDGHADRPGGRLQAH